MSDFPDELRCCRSDNKNWRCARARWAPNDVYCKHHRELIDKNYEKRKKKKEGPPDVVIGITKHCVSNKYKIREPEMAETISLPGDILGLDNLRDVLNMGTWIEYLTPAERSKLSALLPDLEELDKTSIVDSLLNGENLNFGNPATKWAESVCKGEQNPDVLLHKEWELKLSQKQYFKNLKGYHNAFMSSIDELDNTDELKQFSDVAMKKKRRDLAMNSKKLKGKMLWNEIE